jgi:hypothetical protein
VRKVTLNQDLVEILKNLDPELVKGAFMGEKFSELFFKNCKDEKVGAHIKELVG